MIRQRSHRASLEQIKRAGKQELGISRSRASISSSSPAASTSKILLCPHPPPRFSSPSSSARFYSHSSSVRQASVWDSQAKKVDESQSEFTDVTIVGGGVVGLALASSLASDPSFQSSGATMTLIEGSSLDKARQWSGVKQSGESDSIDDWENRVIYLTEENRLWLDKIGVTPYLLSSRLGSVHSMMVTDGVSGAALNFDVPTPTTNRMGTMVEISNLQQAMLRQLEALNASRDVNVKVIDGSKVESIEAEGEGTSDLDTVADSWPVLHHSGSNVPLKSRLLVGADGNNSPVRNYAGIKATGWEYGRMGVVATMKTNGLAVQERTAYQRFLPTGTIAWLPLSNDSASLVWTLPPDVARAIGEMQKDTEASETKHTPPPFAHLITAAFRLPWTSLEVILDKVVEIHKAGSHNYEWIVAMIEEQLMTLELPSEDHVPPPVSSIDLRSVGAFPLKLSHAECYLGSSLLKPTFAESGAGAIQPSSILESLLSTVSGSGIEGKRIVRGRTALIGDAAHTIHPLAGQGLNLGLADSRSLSNSIIRAIEVGGDLGSHISLSQYPKDRYIANQAMLSAVDHLHWLFATPPPGDARNGIVGNIWGQAVLWGRSNGFEILNELSGVKRALMGFAGSEKRS